MVALTIDDAAVEVPEGTTVLEAATKAEIEVPHLCHHEGLHPYGSCRVCTVEITQGGRSRLAAACTYPAEEGLQVRTDTPRVLQGRQVVLELLLARCPEVPAVKEFAAKWGTTETRFSSPEPDDCILCGLCVRACREVVGVEALGFSGRGVSREVATPLEHDPKRCVACGLCTYVCPTGAIQMEAKRLEKLKGAPRTERTCRYMLMGLIPHTICPAAFDCASCEVDQRLEETLGTHPAFVARPGGSTDPVEVGGFAVAPGRHYHPGHVWAARIGGVLRLGVDDFAGKLAGGIEDVELLRERGEEIAAGEGIWRLVLADGRSVTMPSPVSGTLVSVNQDSALDPTLLCKAPYTRGWVCLVRPSAAEEELAALPFSDPAVPYYRRDEPDPASVWMGEEAERFFGLLDGRDPAALSEADWQAVTEAFFGPQP